jgi:hypothetical protein
MSVTVHNRLGSNGQIEEGNPVLAGLCHQKRVHHNRELLGIEKGHVLPRYQLNVHIPSARGNDMMIGHGSESSRQRLYLERAPLVSVDFLARSISGASEIRSPNVGQCPGILNGPQSRDTGTLRRFLVSILEEGGRHGLKCLLLSYFRVGDCR